MKDLKLEELLAHATPDVVESYPECAKGNRWWASQGTWIRKGEALAAVNLEALDEVFARLRALEPCTGEPTEPGRYLVLAYEWAGCQSDKPEKPEWDFRVFKIEEEVAYERPPKSHPFEPDGPMQRVVKKRRAYWMKKEYRFDTGGMENLEVVAWRKM